MSRRTDRAGQTPIPAPATLVDEVLAQVRRHPDAPAVQWRGRTVSYAELADLAGRLPAAPGPVHEHGNPPVALSATKSPTAIALVLGCLMAGRPLLLASADLGPIARNRLTEQAGCTHLATVTDDEVRWDPCHPGTDAPTDTGLLLTTSGSTGVPKIVPIGRSAIDRFTDWAGTQFRLGPGVNVLNYAPLNFDLCLLDVWATLRTGGCVVLVEPEHAVNPRYLVDMFSSARLHVVQAVPMLYRILAEAVTRTGTSFPGVRDVLLTGDHTPRRLRAVLPDLFPDATFHNVYGCTETNDSFLYTFDAVQARTRVVLPLGRPLPGVHATVDGAGTSDGPATGELLVATPFQTADYLGLATATSRFTSDGSHRYFRSGDLVSRDPDGELTLVGRTDFQVKVRGVRVNLEEVEQVILSHAAVAEAAVVAVPDEVAGHRLHAVVRRRSGELTGLGLRQHCATRLVRAAIPAAMHLIDHPLPTTSTGKVNRKQLAAELQKGTA